jgi:tetratricopeptide (TPR) repeat protein
LLYVSLNQPFVKAMIIFTRIFIYSALALAWLVPTSAASQTQLLSISSKDFSSSKQDILRSWHRRKGLKSLSGDSIGEQALLEIQKKQVLFGYRDIPEISIALLREAHNLQDSGKIEDAIEIATHAKLISPSLIEPHQKLLHMHLTKNGFSLSGAINATKAIIKLSISNPIKRIQITYNGLLFILIFATTLLTLATLINGLLSIKLVSYDLKVFLSNYLPSYMFIIILVTLLVGSHILFGLPGVMGIIILCTWKHAAKPLRAAMITTICLIISAGLGLKAIAPQMQTATSKLAQLAEIDNGLANQRKAQKLEDLVKEAGNSDLSLFALSILENKGGRPNDSMRILEQILAQNKNFEKAHVNLANLYFFSGQLQKTIEQYKQLLEVNPRNFLGNYNLGKLYYQEAQIDEANHSLRTAKEADDKSFNELEIAYTEFNLDGSHLFNESIV